MKRKRQSLAALRRLAREAADAFDSYAYKLEIGLAVPSRETEVVTVSTGYRELERRSERAPRIGHPGTPWNVRTEPCACREAARLLRRNPDRIGTSTMARTTPVSVQDTVKDARRLYGDDAAAVLCRQLETIDTDDYPAPAVKRWNAALRQLMREDAAKHDAPTP